MSEHRTAAEQLLRAAIQETASIRSTLAQVALVHAVLAAVDVLTEQVELTKKVYGRAVTAPEVVFHMADGVDPTAAEKAARAFGFDPKSSR